MTSMLSLPAILIPYIEAICISSDENKQLFALF